MKLPLRVANEKTERNARSHATVARSKSQTSLWHTGMGVEGKNEKGKEKAGIVIDPQNPEEILAEELPPADGADAMEKAAIRLGIPYG